jgi:hypothetical protein
MAEYLAPGVYIEEIDAGAQPIEGVSTNTAGFVGVTRRGPVKGAPLSIASFSRVSACFRRLFRFRASLCRPKLPTSCSCGFLRQWWEESVHPAGDRYGKQRVDRDGEGRTCHAFTRGCAGGKSGAPGRTARNPERRALYAVDADSNKGWRHDSIGSSHGYRL